MKLIQKLPIGLGLACMMMLSSCSKEDVVAPEAQVVGLNQNSALKTANVLGVVPILPSTFGTTGFNVYPKDWVRAAAGFSTDLQTFPTGTSDLTHLWGSSLLPWAKPLPAIPGIQNMSSIVTITTSKSVDANSTGPRSGAKTIIRNLKPGKKYTYTLYVSSTYRNTVQAPLIPAYAKQAYIVTSPTPGYAYAVYVNLEGKEAQWIKQTVTFDAVSSEAVIYFSASTAQNGQFAYANLFIHRNSLKQLN